MVFKTRVCAVTITRQEDILYVSMYVYVHVFPNSKYKGQICTYLGKNAIPNALIN